jgi:hypothetical protein
MHTRFFVACLALVACNTGSDPPVSADPPRGAGPRGDEALLYEGPATPYVRIDMRREGESVTVGRAQVVTMKRPVPSLGGEYVAVSLAGAKVIGAVPVAFPTQAHAALVGPDGAVGSRVLPLSSSNATAFLPAAPGLDHVEVRDLHGNVIARASVAAPSSTRTRDVRSLDELYARHPRVYVAQPGDGFYQLPQNMVDDYGAELAAVTPEVLDLVDAGLQAAAPAARASVVTVVPIRMPNFGMSEAACGVTVMPALGGGGELYLNVDFARREIADRGIDLTRERMIRAVVHETAHNFNFLVDAIGTGNQAEIDRWPEDLRGAAISAVREHHLSAGLTAYWEQLQRTAEAFALGGPYRGHGECIRRSDRTIAEGFATDYGASTAHEDIAELTAEMQVVSAASPVCARFASQHGVLLPDAALLYTKALLLRHVGLVTEDAYQRCAAGLRVEPAGEGVVLGENPGPTFALRDSVTATYLAESGTDTLRVKAASAGTRYTVLVRLEDPDRRPLGVHRLRYITTATAASAASGVLVAHDDVYKARASATGLVFVTEATDDRVEGIILMLQLHNAMGVVTDAFWLSRFSAPRR